MGALARPRGQALVAVWLLLASALPARAAPDYAPQSSAWNGLDRLAALAASSGCPLHPARSLDWGSLGPGDSLWWVYPQSPIDPERLRRFLAAGGRAVIADDFGTAGGALAALDLRRLPPPQVRERLQEQPHLPVAHARLSTALGRSTPTLVANHPSALSSALPPTFSFSAGAALVVEGRLGAGRFVAIADPSVLINDMLRLEENHAFAAALIRASCPSGGRIVLLSGIFSATGEPPPSPEGKSAAQRFNEMLRAFDGRLRSAFAAERLLALLALLGAILAVGLATRLYPSPSRLDGSWVRALGTGEDPADEQARAVASTPGLALAATLLREEVVARVAEALGGSARALSPRELERRLAAHAGVLAGRLGRQLWRRLGVVRSAAEAKHMHEGISPRGLRRAQRCAERLFRVLAQREASP